jgi:salicylate 5-hydroxylase large subunit
MASLDTPKPFNYAKCVNLNQIMQTTIPIHAESRIPYPTYTDKAVYSRELERFFYSNHWCYVGLVCEIPNLGDFKRTAIGERSVVLTRAADGDICVVENRCAHRGV